MYYYIFIFRCQYCDKSFAQRYTLKEHTAAKHTFQHGHRSISMLNLFIQDKTNHFFRLFLDVVFVTNLLLTRQIVVVI